MNDTLIQITDDTSPLVAMVIAMAISMLVIPVVWRYAVKLGMMDEPGERKVHDRAIPRVGGLGIIAGALITVFSLLHIDPTIMSFLLGALVIVIFGVWDDTRQVEPYLKFLGQFIAISIIIFYGDIWIKQLPFTGSDDISPWVGIPFTYFAIIGMTNAVNTSDGLDGMAGGESLLSLIVIAFLAYIANAGVDGMVACVIATSCIGGTLGFLRYNTHPADIFMGDTGSQFLGYSLGFLAVLVTQKVHPSLSPALTLLFLGLPVIDLLGVMAIRIKNGHNPLHADRTHIHHRLLDLGFDHYETVIIIYSLQTILVISAIFLRYESDLLIILLYISTAIIILGLLTIAERSGWRTGVDVQERTKLFSTVHYFRSHKIDIIRIAHNVIKIIIPFYFIFVSLFVEAIPRDFGLIAAVLFIVMTLDMIFNKDKNSFSLSGGIYIAAIFSVYLVGHSEAIKDFSYLDIIPFILLAGAIGIVVRYGMDKKFQTSPMDYLIVFGVFAVAVFGERYLQIKDIGILIIKCMVILYGCEVLLMRMEKRVNSLNLISLLALLILAFRGLLT